MMTKILYVQLWENRLRVYDPVSKRIFDEAPLVALREKGASSVVLAVGKAATLENSDMIKMVNPFSHPRLLVSEFELAQAVLKYAFSNVLEKGFLSSRPRVVFQPMEKKLGGISEIEERVYSELCLGCGAMEVVIFDSEEAHPECVGYSEIVRLQKSDKLKIAKRKVSYFNHVLLVLMVILIFYLKKAAN